VQYAETRWSKKEKRQRQEAARRCERTKKAAFQKEIQRRPQLLNSFAINRQNPQGRPLLISWVAGFHRVSKLGLPIVNDFASFFFTLSSVFWHFRMIKTTSFNDLQLKKN